MPHAPPRAPAQVANHPAPFHYNTLAEYAVFVKNINGKTAGTRATRRTYVAAGRNVIAKMNAYKKPGTDAHVSDPLIESNPASKHKANNTHVKLEPRQVYEAAASTLGLDLNKNWRHDEWVTRDAELDISSTFFDADSRTLVSAVAR